MTSNSLYWYRHLFLGITLQFIQRDIYYYTLGTTSASSPFKCTSRNYLYTVFRTVFRTIHCSGCTVPGTINHKQVYGLVSHHIEKHHIWFLCTMDIENQIVNETMTVRSGVFGWNSVPPELNSPVRTIMLWLTTWFSVFMMKRNQIQRKTLETRTFSSGPRFSEVFNCLSLWRTIQIDSQRHLFLHLQDFKILSASSVLKEVYFYNSQISLCDVYI